VKKWLAIALGIVTATGGFVDVGAIATAGGAGAVFGLGLVWAMVLGTLAIVLLVEMTGRLAAVSGKTYAEVIRERFGFKFYVVPLTSELIANAVLLAADLGGIAIALSMFTGLDWHKFVPIAALGIFLLIWRAPFGLIENGPALLGLVTLSFWVGIVALGGPQPKTVETLWQPEVPSGELANYLFLAAAILGAVISPYLLYFYSSGAREERWSRRSLGVNRVTAICRHGIREHDGDRAHRPVRHGAGAAAHPWHEPGRDRPRHECRLGKGRRHALCRCPAHHGDGCGPRGFAVDGVQRRPGLRLGVGRGETAG